jgi:uncharacterized phage-associated protein
MLRFDEAKATQMAALFLRLRKAPMSYMKLLKLIYMADRKALLSWGKPISMDHYVSMKHGPVPSTVYGLMVEEHPAPERSPWLRTISTPSNWEVRLLVDNPPNDRLSPIEEKVIHEIFQEYGALDRWALVERLHKELPEWASPGDSSTPIHYEDILRTQIGDEREVKAMVEELHSLDRAQAALRIV